MSYTVEVVEDNDLPIDHHWIVVRLNGGPPVVYVKSSYLPAWGGAIVGDRRLVAV